MTVELENAPKIRNMAETDIPEVALIEKESIPEPWSENSFRAALANEQAICLVCEGDSQGILGYAVVYFAADEAELVTIAVRSDHRGKHIASLILQEAHDLARKQGAVLVYLEVRESNVPAQGLYRTFGYEICGRRKNFYSNPTEDAVLMKYRTGKNNA